MVNQPNPYAAPQSELWLAGKSHPGSLNLGDEPIAVFRSVLNKHWYLQGYARWARAYSSPVSALLSLLAFAGVVALLAFCAGRNQKEGALVGVLVSITLGTIVTAPFFMGWLLNRWHVQSAFLKLFSASKEFNTVCHFTLYREGLASSCPAIISARKWSGFCSGRRFQDGFLLMFDGRQFYWLPWTDLVSGKPDDVEAILRAGIDDYKGMRH